MHLNTAINAKCAILSPALGVTGVQRSGSCRQMSHTLRAEAPGKSWIPEGEKAAAWDPDGLLPPMPAGGHFARRGESSSSSSTNAAASAPPVPLSTPQQPVSDLLAPRLSAKKSPAKSTTPPVAPVATPVGGATPQRAFGEVPSAPEDALGARVEAAFLETFFGERGVPRVLESFRRLRDGEDFVQLWPGLGFQKAGSYVAGLSATPFPDLYSGEYPWLEEVEKQSDIIIKEFSAAMRDAVGLKAKGNRVWVPAARDEAVAYGPNWRTLVLQDRGNWEETNCKLFPKTKQLLKSLDAPTLEVFFARQDGNTGIKTHTDNANFIQTSHLGVDIPEGECWIKVGDHTKEWCNGKIIVCDTSFMHETQNNSEKDRYVLILRHWHPETTPLERIAMQFLFASLDDPSPVGINAAQKAARKQLKGLAAVVAKGKKMGSGGSGGGFGRKV